MINTTQSRTVESTQTGIHEHIESLVRKHTASQYLRPIPDFSRSAFQEFEQQFAASGKKHIIVDSCCGTGESTAHLAAHYGDCFVVGVDKSAHRLGKHLSSTEALKTSNYVVLRADVEDFVRLMEPYLPAIDKHCIFYPNPYPKPHHIMRRWHGHPLFATMLRLAPSTELRTNWRLYAEEFAFAASLLGYTSHIQEMQSVQPISAFERKYHASGHALFQVMVERP
jgi:tRNA G46 methylase TrmB